MRRRSYLSRIARPGAEDGSALAPARVLFRPLPIADGLCTEAPAIFPTEVTLVESPSGGNPSELTRNVTVPSKPLVPARDTGAPVAPQLSLAPLSRPPVAESSSTVTPGGERLPLRHVSGSMPVPKSAPSSPAKPGQGVSANVEPRVVSAKPALRGSASVEPQFGAARDKARPARPDRHSKAPTRSSNDPVATFDRSFLDMEVHRPISQHRSAHANDSTLVQTTFSVAPVLKYASETPPTLLIPPPPAPREPFAQAPADVEKRAAVSTDAGARVRIGLLEVRIVPPPPIAPPVPASFTRQSQASRPQAALSREFRSFGLTQA